MSASAWTFNGDYDDLSQVEAFWPAYAAVAAEILAADRYPYNDCFKGRIPGIGGPAEDTAIYLLQITRHVRDLAAKVDQYRAAGWRDLDLETVTGAAQRFAGVAEYGYSGHGQGWQEWPSSRVMRVRRSVVVLPGRNRTQGYYLAGAVLVKDVSAAPR